MIRRPGSKAAQESGKAGKVPAKASGKAGAKAGDQQAPGRIRQIGIVAGLIRRSNPKALPITIGSGLAVIVIGVVVGLLTGTTAFVIPLGVLLGVTAAMILFGRYAQSAQYAAIAGQPGAAAAVVQTMRGNWTVTPAIAGNRNMDIVHRVVGKPGVVLIGEGQPNGLSSLMVAEKKRISRIAYGVPIHEIQVGTEQGQIPVRELQKKLMRLPRTLKGPEVYDLNNRMKSLPASLQAPKGPLPRAGRMPRPPRPKVR